MQAVNYQASGKEEKSVYALTFGVILIILIAYFLMRKTVSDIAAPLEGATKPLNQAAATTANLINDGVNAIATVSHETWQAGVDAVNAAKSLPGDAIGRIGAEKNDVVGYLGAQKNDLVGYLGAQKNAVWNYFNSW